MNDVKFSWKALQTSTTSGLHGPNERSHLLVASSGLVEADDTVYSRGSRMLPLSSSASNGGRESTTQLIVLTTSYWSTATARGDAASLSCNRREGGEIKKPYKQKTKNLSYQDIEEEPRPTLDYFLA